MAVRAFKELDEQDEVETWIFVEGYDTVGAQAEGRFIECENPIEVWP